MQTHSSSDRQKLVVLALVGLFYSVGIALLVQNMLSRGFQVTDDFFSRWYDSKMLLTTGRSLYDWANNVELARMGNWPLVHQLGYYYPAYLLIFTAPLSLLPAALARVVWTVIGLWCLWLSMVILADELSPRLPVNRLTGLLVLATLSIPMLQHTLNAQFNTVGGLALALVYRSLRRKEYLAAGLWAGGLLFKPQALAIPLLACLVWTALARERRYFWIGLGLVSLGLWGVAELLEPGWVGHFWQALHTYEPVASIIDRLWNPYQAVSLALAGLTAWLAFRLRQAPVESAAISGLMLWAICLNGLIVPLFGMLHSVVLGQACLLLLAGYQKLYPATGRWMWAATLGLFLGGLAAFIIPLLLLGLNGPHINMAELVYKIIGPVVLAGAALPLMLNREAGHYSAVQPPAARPVDPFPRIGQPVEVEDNG